MPPRRGLGVTPGPRPHLPLPRDARPERYPGEVPVNETATGTLLPRRQTIADDLRNQITTGQLKGGDRLPSETNYQVSAPTLRRALAFLQAEAPHRENPRQGQLRPPPAPQDHILRRQPNLRRDRRSHASTARHGAHHPPHRVPVHPPRGKVTS
ncbi:GntR family transcriptional regulator [Streptomyces sp. GF20]|uniref:GntR family transcriptional regulator n=1 Tax=Streptomyces sp. GF20 TaxID=2692235 RepID=UPI001F30824A|nr:GntR family transcriptional regulator [Streptomyces sp. GF20]